MIKMRHSASTSSLGSEFDAFLFSPVGEDKNGMVLSVLSVLARHDVDPWEQAAKLARLPVETAIQLLASLIAPLHEGEAGELSLSKVSAQLIALLPRQGGTKITTRTREVMASNSRWLLLTVIFVVLVFGASFI